MRAIPPKKTVKFKKLQEEIDKLIEKYNMEDEQTIYFILTRLREG
jgi:hypothetical protein